MAELLSETLLYKTTVPSGGHWSLKVRRGLQLTLTDPTGQGNVGMLLYNPEDLSERYNAPDTLKCQHTFKITQGHCLYSDMGRIFCSVIEDTAGWHETVCGNSNANGVAASWGERDYQAHSNQWHQNGYDSFLVELAKYNLTAQDMAANINWFSKVKVDSVGNLQLTSQANPGGAVTLRFEMDTLVVLHACPHPLNSAATYPNAPIDIELHAALPIADDDECKNACAENLRGFENNRLYYLGVS